MRAPRRPAKWWACRPAARCGETELAAGQLAAATAYFEEALLLDDALAAARQGLEVAPPARGPL